MVEHTVHRNKDNAHHILHVQLRMQLAAEVMQLASYLSWYSMHKSGCYTVFTQSNVFADGGLNGMHSQTAECLCANNTTIMP